MVKAALGDLERGRRVFRVFGMVNATPEFTEHFEVMEGASDLLTELFGERGRHTRCAAGVGSLPAGAA